LTPKLFSRSSALMGKGTPEQKSWMDGELPSVLDTAINDYKVWSEKHLLAFEKRHAIKETLYHYTDASGLKGIIDNQEIWFTDYRYLNDPSELTHGMNLAKALIAKGAKGDTASGFFYRMLGDLFSLTIFSNALEFFIASFSRDRDELGQWRVYADNGRGFAIGFSQKLFAPNDPTDADPTKNMFVGPIYYSNADSTRRHLLAIKKALWVLDKATQYAPRHLSKPDIAKLFVRQLALWVIAAPLIWNCLTCKHPAYASEREVRLIILGMKVKFKGRISTRVRKGEMVPYIKRDMPLHRSGSIVEIVIGPAAPIGAEDGVRALLEKYGIEAPIRRSTIPYRPV